MRHFIFITVISLAAMGLVGCNSAKESATGVTRHDAPAKAGADRDAHGCIPSAGYRWCAKTRQCERPWELTQSHGFARTLEAFDTFCGNASTDGKSEK